MDPIWGYQAINVEAQQADQSSLLHWTRNMIALRKLFQVFGRGTLTFLHPENRKILAYVRSLDREDGSRETVLCVANLSRFAQPVSLDLSDYADMQPVEMLGYVQFPAIHHGPYALTLAPYSFLWLELQPAPAKPAVAPQVEHTDPALSLIAQSAAANDLTPLLSGAGHSLLEQLLPKYLPRQRWFGAKARTISSVSVESSMPLPGTGAALVVFNICYEGNVSDLYQLPLAVSAGEDAAAVQNSAPASVLATVSNNNGDAVVLHDATAREDVRQALLTVIQTSATAQGQNAELFGHPSSAFEAVRGTEPLVSRLGSAEQSNTSLLFGRKLILKLFRRLQAGENPDTEIGRFLTEVAHFPRIAPFLGDITYVHEGGEPTTLAMLQGLVENEGDGWEWTLEELGRFYDSVATCPLPANLGQEASFLTPTAVPAEAREHAGLYLEAAALLGRRTAEMHLALATPTGDSAFQAESFSVGDLQADAERISRQLGSALDAIKRALSRLTESDGLADEAALLLSRRREVLAATDTYARGEAGAYGRRIRIHGDYHLGQVLRAKNDFVILDFEGEPARPLAERRRKQSPLKDVAGMLRSFDYASFAGLQRFRPRRPDDARAVGPWAQLWLHGVTQSFLGSYRQAIAADPHLLPAPELAQRMLEACLLEKALYELQYELNNRPEWVRIPLSGILNLIRS